MPLHVKHASSDYTDIVIATPDTDVFIIALAKQAVIDVRLFILTGINEKRRFIDLHAVGDVFIKFNRTDCTKDKFLNALLGFHCFTGCDSISAFASRGKIKPLTLIGACEDYVDAFSCLRATKNVQDETLMYPP